MSGLPEGWTNTGLVEIATLLRGVTYTKGDASDSPFSGSVPVLRANNIQGEKFDFSDLVHVPRDLVADSQLIRAGDVVVATSSGSISVVGKAAQARSKIEAGFGAFCGLLRPSSEVEPRYFGHYFSSAGYRSTVSEMARGVNINNLKREHFESLQIPLAPLPEQKRIADKLDSLLARVGACREHLDRVPAILKRFRQSVLAAATSGELTREWREARGIGTHDWQQSTAGQLIDRIEAGLNVQCEERPPEPNERGLVKISAVTWGRYDDNQSKTLPGNADVPERSRIGLGDFLISRANTLELVGACVIVEHVTRPVFLSDKVLRLVMPERLKPWLQIALQSPAGRKAIESRASGNQLSMRNLSQANLREIPISLPPHDEMVEVVGRVRRLLDVAKEIERRTADAASAVQRSVPSTLAKAFRGDLVPQDPNDEPAAALLARIAAARQTAPEKLGAKLGRRRGGRHAHAD